MSEADERDEESEVNEPELDAVLGRFLGHPGSEVIKALLLRHSREETGSPADRLLREVENVNPWLAEVLRRASSLGTDPDWGGRRTQRSTSARKDDK